MGVVHTITEGGQIWTHRFRMFKQVVKITSSIAFMAGLATFCIQMLNTPAIHYQASWYYAKGYLLQDYFNHIEVDAKFWEAATKQRHSKSVANVPTKRVLQVSWPYVTALKKASLNALSMALFSSNVAFTIVLIFFLIRGRKSKAKQHLSGKKISPSWYVALKLKLTRKASEIRLGTLPLVKGTESQHMLITGGTGTGKTNCLHHILTKIRSHGQKAIIIDTTGAFVDQYYSSNKDIILSPFHAKTAKWHPWAECKTQFDFSQIAEAFIPQTHNESDNYWRQASRAVFCSMLEKLNDRQRNSQLIEWILYRPLAEVCNLMQGTKAAAHMDISSERTASSIRSVAGTFLSCLECLEDSDNPFSIRNWMADKNQDSWLFLHCTPSERATVRPLLSAWISSAIGGLLALEPDLNKKIWFIIDELPSLQKVKDIEVLLTEGRKYGGCGILSLQSPSQLEAIYGREVTKTIIGNTATKVTFAEQDPEIAERISKAFGEREIKECQEGISYGANDVRDGVNLSLQIRHQLLVTPTLIQSLNRNEAFIKLPGNLPIAKMKLAICK